MMTKAMPETDCLAIGLLCLTAVAILSLFSGSAETAPKMRRPAAPRPSRPVSAAKPQPAARNWQPPGKAPAKPAVEPHPAIFATVAGRSTGLSSSRRRE